VTAPVPAAGSALPARVYPLSVADGGVDPRFTFGLHLDVARVLEAHGYPPCTPMDFVELSLVLLGFLYSPQGAPVP
jgi:hypothetical protein